MIIVDNVKCKIPTYTVRFLEFCTVEMDFSNIGQKEPVFESSSLLSFGVTCVQLADTNTSKLYALIFELFDAV